MSDSGVRSLPVYVDSGVLIKLYVREPNSARAAAAVKVFRSVPLTPVHELEIRNTFFSLEGRGAITSAQRAAAEHTFDLDIAAGRLRRLMPDWPAVFSRSLDLARNFTASVLARSLDVLHVATAASIGSTETCFVTSDRRQALLAERAGLETVLVE